MRPFDPSGSYTCPVWLLILDRDRRVVGERLRRSDAESFARHYNATLGKGDSPVVVRAAEATIRVRDGGCQ